MFLESASPTFSACPHLEADNCFLAKSKPSPVSLTFLHGRFHGYTHVVHHWLYVWQHCELEEKTR
eukprot:1797419-Amphidinium_carterae.2